MEKNKYSWNKLLKFSWGHIIAFVALIFISYITYMGAFYTTSGDFKMAGLKVFLIDILLIVTFIGAQLLKGTDSKFDKSIKIERLLIYISPIVLLWALIPYNHFWNVFREKENIVKTFTAAIDNSKTIFSDYDYYSKERIKNYDSHLTEIINNKNSDLYAYLSAGFGSRKENIIKRNYIHALDLQLNSENTDSLKTMALTWIEKANNGATVWNAFLVGNLKKIKDAIGNWHNTLSENSAKKMSNEDSSIMGFGEIHTSYDTAIENLNKLKNIYVNTHGLNLYTIFSSIILYIMLLFPYFLQNRNLRAKGYYHLFPDFKSTKEIPKMMPEDDEFEETTKKENREDPYDGTF